MANTGAITGNTVIITDHDIHLIQQQHQRRYFKLQILNRAWASVGEIKGQVISGTINIDASSNLRRTASINMYVARESIRQAADFSMQNYLQIWCGIEDNVTSNVTWYSEGVYIVSQHNYKFDATSRTLTMSLVDLMADLNGDRGGTLHAYTTLVKYGQDISTVMAEVLEICGYNMYNIVPVGAVRNLSSFIDKEDEDEEEDSDDTEDSNDTETKDNQDFKVPYDITFNPGVTAYEILDKLVSLYPYYRMRFDVNGVFVCDKVLIDYIGGVSRFQNYADFAKLIGSMTPLIDASVLDKLIISEDKSIDWTQVKNYIEVWGKDGQYYGEAFDDNPVSPFNVASIGELRAVYSGDIYDNIYDRYRDPDKVESWFTEQAQYEAEIGKLRSQKPSSEEEKKEIKEKINEINVKLTKCRGRINANICVYGNDMAKDYADKLLYENCRVNDSLTLQTIFMPFINDVDFQITHRTKLDNSVNPYIIKSVSHDLGNNTSSINAIRFYRNVSAYNWTQLDAPVIKTYSIDGMTITIDVKRVTNATSYILYFDFDVILISNSPVITYTFPDQYAGRHSFYVTAFATGYLESNYDEIIHDELSYGTAIVVDTNTNLITENSNIILAEK